MLILSDRYGWILKFCLKFEIIFLLRIRDLGVQRAQKGTNGTIFFYLRVARITD